MFQIQNLRRKILQLQKIMLNIIPVIPRSQYLILHKYISISYEYRVIYILATLNIDTKFDLTFDSLVKGMVIYNLIHHPHIILQFKSIIKPNLIIL